MMDKSNMSRKERRKSEQKQVISSQMKKNTTAFSSALIVSTVATPAILPSVAEATSDNELNTAQVSQLPETQTTTEATTDSAAPSTSTEPTADSNTTTSQTTTEVTQNTTEATTEDTTVAAASTTDPVTSPTPTTTDALGSVMSPKAFAATTRSTNPATFIAEIAAVAQSVAAKNDLYASVMMAQAIVESGWGGSTLSQAPNYNLFGIKGSYQGQTVYMDTWEYLNGQWVIKKEPFRKYPSYQESFQDNAYVLRTTSFQAGVYFYSGTWKSNTNSYKDATAWLTGRYATDPSYGTKLNNVISAYNLTQYDTPAANGNTGNGNYTTNPGGNNNTGGATSDVYHTVQAGDSLWALAAKYNTTIANIKSWNRLSSDTIYVGQKLIVKKGTSGNTSGGSTNNGNTNTGNTSNTGNTYYTVKSGDTLSAIASRHGISLANLRAWNNISGDLIYPGQKLIVKKGTSGNTSGGSTNSGNTNAGNTGNTSNTGNTYYTVKSGDTLSAIASRHGISLANLRAWNNISGDLIYPGQKFIVKKGTSGNTSGGSTNSGNTNAGNAGNTSNTGNTYYTVKSGDTLSAIAFRHGISLANLRAWNNATSDLIFPGQKLIVKKGTSTGTGGSTSNVNISTKKTHTVQSGDTLWDLARKYNTSIQKIKQLNGLSGDIIYIGQVLKIA